MGPFIRSSNTKFKTEINIIICFVILMLFSTYKSIVTFPTFGIKSFYPIVMVLTSLVCSIITSFAYSKITKNDLKLKPNLISALILPLMLGINVPIYLIIIGTIIIEIISKIMPSKLYYIDFTLIIGLLILLVCYFILKIDPYLFYGEVNTISNIKDIGTYESLITPYSGFKNFFIGLTPGVIGGSSLICILSLIYLGITKNNKWKIALSSILTISVLTFFTGYFSGIGSWYILYILMTSSTLFGILLSTISKTTPVTPIGQVLYGIFIGILTIIIRYFVSINEAIFISVILISLLTPLLDKIGSKSRFHFNKCLGAFTIAWGLIISICLFMFINYKKIDEFEIISKTSKENEVNYLVSYENNIGKIEVEIKIENKKIVKFDITNSSDKNIDKIDKEFIYSITSDIDNIDNIPNIDGYYDTCDSLKKIVKNTIRDYEKNHIN